MDLKCISFNTRKLIKSTQDRDYDNSCESGIKPPGSISYVVNWYRLHCLRKYIFYWREFLWNTCKNMETFEGIPWTDFSTWRTSD